MPDMSRIAAITFLCSMSIGKHKIRFRLLIQTQE